MVVTDTPSLETLALEALALVRGVVGKPHPEGERVWTFAGETGSGQVLWVTLRGPDLPDGVPSEIAKPQEVADERPFVGTYRLVVTAPLIVLDLYWTPGEPVRIMSFSRGDWEADLLRAAGDG